MNNKNFNKFKIIFFLLLFCFNANSSEQFQFEVTEIEILENGNLFKGIKRGTIQTNGGIIIKADNFVYDKITNIINAEGKVKIEDKINNYTIFSEKLIYKKNEEFIITDGNSKALDEKNKVITAKKFTYNKILNILNAEGNARIEDISEDYVIYSGYITYYKNDEKITTKGETEADIKSEYNIKSRDVVYLEKLKKLSSKQKTVLKDSNSQIYFLDEFDYLIDKSLFKANIFPLFILFEEFELSFISVGLNLNEIFGVK